MQYHNHPRSTEAAYNKNTHEYCFDYRYPIIHKSDDWTEAISDSFGCKFVLPIDFLNKPVYSKLNKQLVDTGRIAKIEYIIYIFSPEEEYEKMLDADKERLCTRCVEIHLSDTQQTNIMMRENEDVEFRAIPYEHVRANYVLLPERYPIIAPCWKEENGEPLSNHIHIGKFKPPTCNAPDTLLMIGDILRGIDDLPAVLPTYEKPKNAVKIDLEYWFPEYLRARLIASQNYIIYGTALGCEGEKQRLNRILKMRICRPLLSEQMDVMLKNDLSLDTSLSSSSVMPSNLQKIAQTLGGATALGTAATVIGGTTVLGSAMTGLATMAGPLALIGLGIWGASKLLKDYCHESGETPEWLNEEEKALEQRRIQEQERIQQEEQRRKETIAHLQESSLSEEERIHEENRLRGLHFHEDDEYLNETERAGDEYIQALKCAKYRWKLDSIVCDIMHTDLSKVDFERITDLYNLLLDVPNNIYGDNYLWLHNIKIKELDNIQRIIEDIQDIKQYLSENSDSQEENSRPCSEPIEKACPRCAETLDANFAAGIGFVPNVCYTLLKTLRYFEIKYREKHTIFTTKALKDAQIEQAKAEAAQREAEARADERQNILYEMSHHIKNLIVSVINPLESLIGNIPEDDRFVLETAIKGADMIRQIVFFISNSYRCSEDDFHYDLNNPMETPQTLGSLFENTLRASIASMFDKQAHEKSMRRFYPTRNAFDEAKKTWFSSNTLYDVLIFMEKHMNIKVEISLEAFKDIIIGNTKGSATNIAILFNELTMNMLKALAIVPESSRFFSIKMKKEGENLILEFRNSVRTTITNSSGYGKTIVANIVTGFGGTVSYDFIDSFFEVKLALPLFKQL